MADISLNVSIDFSFPEEELEDVVVCMLEGGCGYWACLDNATPEFENAPDDEPVSITAYNILKNGGSVRFEDEEDDGAEYFLTMEKLVNGIRSWIVNGYALRYCLDYKNGRWNIDWCNFDGEAGDIVAQYAMLGDVIYG